MDPISTNAGLTLLERATRFIKMIFQARQIMKERDELALVLRDRDDKIANLTDELERANAEIARLNSEEYRLAQEARDVADLLSGSARETLQRIATDRALVVDVQDLPDMLAVAKGAESRVRRYAVDELVARKCLVPAAASDAKNYRVARLFALSRLGLEVWKRLCNAPE